jgi:O-antigen/teichoic acid export membrane protein
VVRVDLAGGHGRGESGNWDMSGSALVPAPDAASDAPSSATSAPPAKPAPRKSVGKQALIYGIGDLANKAVSFVMLPIYTSYLTPADYGVVSLIEMTFSVFAIIAGSRLAAGVFRFYHKADTEAERHRVVTTAQGLVALLFGTIAAMVATLGPQLSQLVFETPAYGSVLRLAAASWLLQGMLNVPMAYLTATERPVIWVSVGVAKLFCQALGNWFCLAHFHLGLRSVYVSSLAVHFAFQFVVGGLMLRETGFGFSRRAARDLLRFWWPLVFTQMSLFVSVYGDRYFLQRAGGPAVVGLYALAYNFGFLLATVGFSPFARVWDSVRFRFAKEAGHDAVFARAFVNVNVLLVTVATGIIVLVRDVLRVMAAPPFHAAANLVPIIVVAYGLQCWTMMHDVGIMVKERTGYNTLGNWVGGLVALGGYALLIPRYLGYGAAWATLLSFAARWVVIYTASQRLWPIRYEWAPVFRLLVVGAVTSGVGFAVPTTLPLPTSIAIRAALLTAYALVVWRLGVIDPAVRARVVSAVRGARQRFA